MSVAGVSRHQALSQLRVLVSASQDVFWNLALEDALFRRLQLQVTAPRVEGVALLYRNQPCVVVGLHQNPWLECRVRDAEMSGVAVARRLSGGGTVYHDLGNWNLSFITPSAWHKREANAEFVRRLCERFAGPGKEVTVGKRHDIYCQGLKVAGSAAKLARGAAYHHFCILLSADLSRLGGLLGSSLPPIVTNATSSVRSRVANLAMTTASGEPAGAAAMPPSPQLVLAAVSDELAHSWDFSGPALSVGPSEVGPHNLASAAVGGLSAAGVQETAERLRSWDWVFGRTPNFECHLPPPCSLTLSVQKGHVTDLTDSSALGLASHLRPFLIGQPCRASVLLPYLNCFRDTGQLDPIVVDQLERVFACMGH